MSTTQTTDHQAHQWYLKNFELFERSLNGEASTSIHQLRKSAISRFVELRFPTTRNEEWKYTDLQSLVRRQFRPVFKTDDRKVVKSEVAPLRLLLDAKCFLVVVDGHFHGQLSSLGALPKGVKVGGLADALRYETDLVEQHLARYAGYGDVFTALSTAFLHDGIFIHIPRGKVVENPIHVVFVSTGGDEEYVTHPRSLIVAGKHSQLALVEHFVSLKPGKYFTNAVMEVVLDENAVVDHVRLQEEDEQAFHIATLLAHQARSSVFVSHAITLGGRLVRNNITSVLDGEGAESTLNGLYLGTGEQHLDNHTTIDHAKAHCTSHELYKGILAGKSRGVFNGKIIVRPNAQKTNAKQTNKNLLLSDESSIDTKPQLEIFANDVKCTHGATIGQIDPDAMFYLRSRGIDRDAARDMLIHAFASDVLEFIKSEQLREVVKRKLLGRLHAARS